MLTLIKKLERKNGSKYYGLYKCDCGNEKEIIINDVNSGHTKSCGCYHKKRVRQSNLIHNLCGTDEYIAWINMKQRCYNKNSTYYYNYGGREIKVCDYWLESFKNFLKDMGKKPSKKHSIERRDNNGNYEKQNCYWGTRLEQNANKRSNIILTYNGQTRTLIKWCQILNLNYNSIYQRIRKGWSIEKAFNISMKVYNK